MPPGLVILGLIIAEAHLGTPVNAPYVITGIGRSPHSNEVFLVVIFLIFGSAYWIVSFRDDVPRLFRIIWLSLTILSGLLSICFIGTAYAISTIPTWDLITVQLILWAGSVATGILISFVTLTLTRQAPSMRAVYILLAASIVCTIATAIF
ncbi:MAG: dimethyl sulfoxide reductase anchor subunit [Eggerthellaceae bacterium]|nr:dimethyl sulfoxide reductase anchor subunit [Eggerthellaceae bacterium]